MKCLVASALVLGTLASASTCPLDSVKATVYDQVQEYQGSDTPFKWYFSPCATTNAPGLPEGCAGGPGYLQEYNDLGNNACQLSLGTQVSAWIKYTDSSRDEHGYTASFSNAANLCTATIKVRCNASAAAGVTPVGKAVATSPTPGAFHWDITLESSNSCGSATQPPITTAVPESPAPTSSVCPLQSVQPTVWNQNQVYMGQTSEFTWFLDPCHLSTAGSDYPSCAEGEGFFQEFNTKANGAACQMSLSTVVSPWTAFSSTGSTGYKASFKNPSGYRTVDIEVRCDIDAPDGLAPIGNVEVTSPSSGAYHYKLTVKSRQACMLTPTVGPITESPASSCPLDAIVPVTYTQNQIFQGNVQPFVWYFNPCTQANRPAAQSCSGGPGYLQEFSPSAAGGQCQMSLNTIVVGWMKGNINGSVSYNTNFQNRAGDRVAQVFVICDESVPNLEPFGDAVATQSTSGPGSFIWEIYLKSSKICPREAPTTTSAVTTPAPTQTDCGAYNEKGCTACTTAPSGRCGYCLETKTCVEGTSSGPSQGSCPSSRWEWYPTQCQ